MSQINLIVEQLKLAFEGDPWHGPGLMEILEGIDATQAADRPITTAHSSWEVVLHLTGWGRIQAVNDIAWKQAVQTLRQTHAQLIEEVAALSEAKLNERVPGKKYNSLFMLSGIVQHAAYHGGQIALLKRFHA